MYYRKTSSFSKAHLHSEHLGRNTVKADRGLHVRSHHSTSLSRQRELQTSFSKFSPQGYFVDFLAVSHRQGLQLSYDTTVVLLVNKAHIRVYVYKQAINKQIFVLYSKWNNNCNDSAEFEQRIQLYKVRVTLH
jgi:hypothetical protein